LSKDGKVGEVKEVIVTGKIVIGAAFGVTGLGVP
jgi:hypothetical protein